MAAPSGVRGFLFADLRGYTAFVERHGDDAAAELLGRYREVVRSVIAAHAGAEIRTEGDGFYVVFDSVAEAVDAGLDLIAQAASATAEVPTRPLRVGIGIHAGETSSAGEGPVGSAVNIAARVCAKAEPGELLVTETVRSLIRTARPYKATAIGPQHLKGVAEAIPLYLVEPAGSPGRSVLRRRVSARRGRFALVGLAVVALLVAAGGYWAANRPVDCLTVPAKTKDVVLRIDPARDCVVGMIAVGQGPRALAASDDAIWVADQDDWTVAKVDVETSAVGMTGVGGRPIDLDVAETGDVVVLLFQDKLPVESTDRSLVGRIDQATLRLTDVMPLPRDDFNDIPGWTGIDVQGGQSWVVNHRGYVAKEPGHAAVSLQDPIFDQFGSLQSASTRWIVDGSRDDLGRRRERPRPIPDRRSRAAPDIRAARWHDRSTALDATDAAVWVGRTDGQLTRLDPFRGVAGLDAIRGTGVGHRGDGLRRLDHQFRCSRRPSGSIRRTTSVTSIPVGGRPSAIVVGPDGDIYVALADQ